MNIETLIMDLLQSYREKYIEIGKDLDIAQKFSSLDYNYISLFPHRLTTNTKNIIKTAFTNQTVKATKNDYLFKDNCSMTSRGSGATYMSYIYHSYQQVISGYLE